MNAFVRRAAFFAALVISLGANADGVGKPSGSVMLTIDGAIEHANATTASGDAAQFDRAMLEALENATVATTTDWTDGVRRFSGPLASAVLDQVGAKGATVLATALNDYAVEIPISDFRKYPVILAMTMDGKPLSRRDKGPLWIVYPRDDYAELATPETNTKWIWQLKSLTVR